MLHMLDCLLHADISGVLALPEIHCTSTFNGSPVRFTTCEMAKSYGYKIIRFDLGRENDLLSFEEH